MKCYKVDEETLINLLKSDAKLEALESGGVDNWSYYGESLYDYADEVCDRKPDELASEAIKRYAKEMLNDYNKI